MSSPGNLDTMAQLAAQSWIASSRPSVRGPATFAVDCVALVLGEAPQEEHLWCTLLGRNSHAPARQTSSRRRASSRSRAIALLRWKRDVPYTVVVSVAT